MAILPDSYLIFSSIRLLADTELHEIAYRDFMKAALVTNAIPALDVNFSVIDFNSRANVLGTAKTVEDLGVPAYNGAGKLFVGFKIPSKNKNIIYRFLRSLYPGTFKVSSKIIFCGFSHF